MKTFLKFGWIVLLIIAIGLIVLSVALNSTIKVGVESIGPAITGTNVTLEDVDLSLFTGKGQLGKLVIGNPQGFQTDHAFYLGVIYVQADLTSLWSDTIRIQEIFIDSPEISFESTPSGSNIGIIHKNIGSFGRSGGESERGQSKQGGKSQEENTWNEKKIRIDQFIIKNGRVTVSSPLLKEHSLTIRLPVVHLRDIGKQSGGATLKEISSLIYSETQKAIERTISKRGIPLGKDLKELDKKLGGIIKDASKFFEGIKGIFDK